MGKAEDAVRKREEPPPPEVVERNVDNLLVSIVRNLEAKGYPKFNYSPVWVKIDTDKRVAWRIAEQTVRRDVVVEEYDPECRYGSGTYEVTRNRQVTDTLLLLADGEFIEGDPVFVGEVRYTGSPISRRDAITKYPVLPGKLERIAAWLDTL